MLGETQGVGTMRFYPNLSGIDFDMLGAQKTIMLELIEKPIADEEKLALSGIIHLIDNIQDQAVERGFTELQVFGLVGRGE